MLKISKELTEEQRDKIAKERRLENLENILVLVKLLGAMFFYMDIFVKIGYYKWSRFFDVSVKDFYKALLMVRPFLIIGVVLYNLIIGLKLVRKMMGSDG